MGSLLQGAEGLNQHFSNSGKHRSHLGIFLNADFGAGGLGRVRVCIANRVPGEAEAASPGQASVSPPPEPEALGLGSMINEPPGVLALWQVQAPRDPDPVQQTSARELPPPPSCTR